MEFNIGLDRPFNLQYTLESGQVFRWERNGAWWVGDIAGGAVKVLQEGEWLRCVSSSEHLGSTAVGSYLRLDDDLDGVLAPLMSDEVITKAAQEFYGMHLIRQDKWECLASFLLATNANIPRIKKMVGAICARFGEPFEFEGATRHSFPRPDALASQSVSELAGCGLGYRAAFLKKVATSVRDGKIDFAELSSLPYREAHELLLAELRGEKVLLGVGPKVADCVLLYSCGKDEAFPIDVWIGRALAKWYPKLIGPQLRKKLLKDGSAKLGEGDYYRISEKMRAELGKSAGYAQQYLYALARSGAEQDLGRRKAARF